MTVATFVQPDSTAQTGTAYKANIDAAVKVASRSVQWFAPHEESSLAMTVRLEAGFIQTASGLAEVSAQSTGTISAPSSDPRKDLIVVDAGNGAVSVITGTEDASPTVPTLTAGKIPIAVVTLATDTTAIDNTLIEDVRSWGLAPATTAEMQAGTETELRAMSPAAIAASIAALASVADQLARDGVYQSLMEIDALSGQLGPRSYGVAIGDALEDQSGIDTGALINAVYDAGNGSYSNVNNTNALTGGTATASSANGASVASNAADGNTGTFWQANTNEEATGWWSYDLGVGNDAAFDTWRQYWDGSSSGIETADIKASATGAFAGEETTVASGVDFNLSGPAGWFDVTFPAPGTTYRYWRIYSLSAVNTSNLARPKVFEFEAFNSVFGNITVQSEAGVIESDSLASDPTEIRVQADVEAVDALTLFGGTPDIILSASRDGNTTFSTITLDDTAALPANVRRIIRGTAIVSGQPTGKDVVVKLVSANSKKVRLHGWTIQADQKLTVS